MQQVRVSTTSSLKDHPIPAFKKALEEYDKKYTTLIDYFGIIGPSIDHVYSMIEKAKGDG